MYVVPDGMGRNLNAGEGAEKSDETLRFMPEGHARPDFFRGVSTIVCKLFNIIRPNVAYFGKCMIGITPM